MIPNRPPDLTHQALFQGKGTVYVWDCSPKKETMVFPVVLWCVLTPDGQVGKHKQVEYHEVLTCIAGNAELRINDSIHPFAKGTSITLVCGEVLSIHNHSEEPLVYLITKTPN